jgi:hypothetical protein
MVRIVADWKGIGEVGLPCDRFHEGFEVFPDFDRPASVVLAVTAAKHALSPSADLSPQGGLPKILIFDRFYAYIYEGPSSAVT